MNPPTKIWLGLGSILLLSALFRFYHLGSNPPALFRDEAEKGYTAYSLARTGGYFYFSNLPYQPQIVFQPFPLFINVFGVYTSAVYQYVAVPFIAIGGLNEVTVRAPAALAGVITVLLTFLLLSCVADHTTALIGAFFVAVSPWHIQFSRWAQQGILIPLFTTAGLYFFLTGLQKTRATTQKRFLFLLGSLFFVLAFYGYAVCRLFIPLLLVVLAISYRREIRHNLRTLIPAVVVFVSLAIIILYFYLQPERMARLRYLSIFAQGLTVPQIAWQLVKNYLSHYSPSFLFFNGDRELRHSLLGFGEMYLFSAPLLIYGIWVLLRRRRAFDRLILGWFLIFPIPASLTAEGIPHALRSIVGIPVPQIICALGAGNLVSAFQKKYSSINLSSLQRLAMRMLAYLLMIIISISVIIFGFNLFVFYPYYSAQNWQYGVKLSLDYIHQNKIPPQKVYLSGYITYAPYLVLFYEKTPPTLLKKEGIRAIKYNFLPPGVAIDNLWDKLPDDSYLVLYPGELFGHKPIHIIPLPHRKNTRTYAPALLIFHKG
ncbi:glycosyltransferase family 39 protein [Candidatus Sumerlaeota bacterium]|nr:glycosyltransferase family 39 protein [Candidatus Sumerlaeota bacterium]